MVCRAREKSLMKAFPWNGLVFIFDFKIDRKNWEMISYINRNIFWNSRPFLVKLWETARRNDENFPFFKKQVNYKNRSNKIPLTVRRKFTIKSAGMSMLFFPCGYAAYCTGLHPDFS